MWGEPDGGYTSATVVKIRDKADRKVSETVSWWKEYIDNNNQNFSIS